MILPVSANCSLEVYIEQFNNKIFREINFINVFTEDYTKYYNNNDLTCKKMSYRKNIVLDGYFQSEKFFNKELVKKTFAIDEKNLAYILKKYPFLRHGNTVTSINVRRGDYVKQPHLHPVCSLKYYKNGINYIGSDTQYLIISDDITWCRKNFKGENYIFVENEKPIIDLYLQTLCRNNIISNSSFSWWGA